MDAVDIASAASNTADPRTGLLAVAALRRLTDTLELAQVESALACGLGWSQTADLLGVTRQAVHKKYAKRVAPGLAPKKGKRA